MSSAPRTHLAVAFPTRGAPLVELHLPTPSPDKDEVLVKVLYASPTPLDVWQGHLGLLNPSFPLVPTDCIVGDVIQLGADVRNLTKGDRVLSFSFGPNKVRGAQEYALLPHSRVGKLPPNVDPLAGATVSNNLVTAFHTITNDLGLSILKDAVNNPISLPERMKHARILVWGGASSVGQYAIQLLSTSGYTNVLTTASARHHDHLRAMGATHVADYKSTSLYSDLGGPVDYVFDTIGAFEEGIAKYTPLVQTNGAVAILLPIRHENDTRVEMSLDDGTFDSSVTVKLVRTHHYEQNTFYRDHLQPDVIPAVLAAGLIRPNRARLVEGATVVERTQRAIDLLAQGAVSGEKLVIQIPQEI